jgi:hypothetical protein
MSTSEPDFKASRFLRNCKFKFKCYKSWDDLERTDNPAISFCGDCKKNVYYCETPEELNFAIAKNLCVAIRHDHPKAAHRQLSLGSVIDPWPLASQTTATSEGAETP